MKSYIKIISSIFSIGIIFMSCTDKEPSIDDNFLNYQIQDVTLTESCQVGAYYYNNGSTGLNTNAYARLTDIQDLSAGKAGPYVQPVLDNYTTTNSIASVQVIQQHVDWAIAGGIDFLVMPGLTEDATKIYPNNITADNTRFVNLVTGRIGSDGLDSLLTTGSRVNMKGLKYALSVNPANTSSNPTPVLDNNNLIEYSKLHPLTGLSKVQRFNELFKRISDYFSDPHYYKINGKPVVVILNPQLIYAENTAKLYDDMRAYVKVYCGQDIYIIAQQVSWTPPARNEYFHIRGKVDALTYTCMYNQPMADRSYWYPQLIDQNWMYSRNYLMTNWNIDFVPNVSPSFTYYVNTGANYDIPIINKDPKVFRTFCNVAKKNLGRNRVVLIESFNQWAYNTAIEPTKPEYGNGYGTSYLDIVKEQFKK